LIFSEVELSARESGTIYVLRFTFHEEEPTRASLPLGIKH